MLNDIKILSNNNFIVKAKNNNYNIYSYDTLVAKIRNNKITLTNNSNPLVRSKTTKKHLINSLCFLGYSVDSYKDILAIARISNNS